jgi:hypothetical protein
VHWQESGGRVTIRKPLVKSLRERAQMVPQASQPLPTAKTQPIQPPKVLPNGVTVYDTAGFGKKGRAS